MKDRRSTPSFMTPAEVKIREAILEVKKIAVNPKLADAVTLLAQANGIVSDYIDEKLNQN